MTVVVVWDTWFKPGAEADGLRLTRRVWADMRSFDGFLAHELLVDEDASGHVIAIARWRSREDADRVRDAYKDSDTIRQLTPLLLRPRERWITISDQPLLNSGGPPNRETFNEAYAGEAPWDIGRPQAAFVAAADRVVSPVLDAGCGTGDIALFLAGRGHRVTGIDYVEEAIRRARAKAAQRSLVVDFRVGDALALETSVEQFATAIDCGLFHVFPDDDRRRYVSGLKHVLEPGGRLFLMCFSDEEPGMIGPRRVSQRELREAFSDGWEVESIEPSRFEVNPKFTGATFSEGGPKTWFVVVQRS